MREVLQEISNILNEMNQRDLWDYAAIIVPLTLSIVAIFISIHTTIKQNKIAMFEKRYNCFFQIREILNFAETIKEYPNANVVLGLFDAFWGTNTAELSGNGQTIKAKTQLEIIKKEIVQTTFLFKHKFVIAPIDVFRDFHAVIWNAIAGNELNKSIDKFILTCDNFKKNDLEKLKKAIKM